MQNLKEVVKIDITKLNINFSRTQRNVERKITQYINDKTRLFKKNSERITSIIDTPPTKSNKLYNSKIEKVVLNRLQSEEIERCEQFEQCISLLSEKEKQLIEKHYIEGLSIKQIMNKNQLSKKSVDKIFRETIIKIATYSGCLVINNDLLKRGETNAKK